MELDKPYQGAFRGSTHHFALRVYIEDTDVGGVVYHARYVGFLERARSDMLRCLGIDQWGAIQSGEGVYAVTELSIKYVKPARLDDDLVILTTVTELRAVTCGIAQVIRRGGDVVSQAKLTAAFLNRAGRPHRHPVPWAEKFQAVLSSAPELAPGAHANPKS